ncbi:MAG: VOC family protein [Pseudomonadota bacterium]
MARKKPVKAAPKKKPPAKKMAKPKITRDGGPMGWPTLSTYLVVQDATASVRFYQAAFGFRVEGALMKDDRGLVQHAGMRLGEAAIMFGPRGMSPEMRAPATSGAVDSLSMYVYVPDVDALTARALRAGAHMLQSPADQFWRDRVATFKDPDGYHWSFATHLGN